MDKPKVTIIDTGIESALVASNKEQFFIGKKLHVNQKTWKNDQLICGFIQPTAQRSRYLSTKGSISDYSYHADLWHSIPT